MSTRWRNARSELGVHIHWRYAFVPHGAVALPGADMVYFDVGGSHGPGIIDHHQGGPAACSSARLMLRRPDWVYEHLTATWRSAQLARGGGPQSPLHVSATIVLHDQPDFDAIVSAFLARKLVEDGDFPPYAESLASYADRVDQGLERVSEVAEPELYPLMLMLMNSKIHKLQQLPEGPIDQRNERTVRLGSELVELWAHAAMGKPGPRVKLDLKSPLVKELFEELRDDASRFVKLSQDPSKVVDLGMVNVPTTQPGVVAEVRGATIPEIEEGACLVHYLRATGATRPAAALTAVRQRLRSDQEGLDRRRVIISVDPAARSSKQGHALSLQGLGAALEIAEQRRRQELGPSFTKERQGPARFSEFSNIEDPWYDGRGHDFTIIDAPRSGSVLTLNEIVGVIQSPFWEPTIVTAVMLAFRAGRSVEYPIGRKSKELNCGDLLTGVQSIRADKSDGCSQFVVVVADINTAWGEDAISRFAREVTGGSTRVLDLQIGRCYIGSAGVLVATAEPQTTVQLIRPQCERILELVVSLAETDAMLAASRSAGETCRGLLRKHTLAVAKFHSTRSLDAGADVMEFVHALEGAFDMTARVDGVGQLLEHLSDHAERTLFAQLNRLVFLVGLFGVLQTAAALDSLSDRLGAQAVRWIFWGLITFAIASFVPAVARLMRRVPVVGRVLFDDVEIAPPRTRA